MGEETAASVRYYMYGCVIIGELFTCSHQQDQWGADMTSPNIGKENRKSYLQAENLMSNAGENFSGE